MSRLRFIPLLCAGLLAPSGALAEEAAAPTPPTADAQQQVIAFLRSYEAAFNSGDAAKVAALWAEDGVWTSDESAETTSGREAIEAGFAEVFAASPGLSLAGDLTSLRVVAPGVVCIDGETRVTRRDADPGFSAFTAVVVQRDGKWLLASVNEHALAVASPTDALEDLAFLVGEWIDEQPAGSTDPAVQVETSVRWGEGDNFLIRSYTVTPVEGEPTKGTQVIGWDPRSRQVRSWTFDADGSFGEGHWSRVGEQWIGRLSQTLATGDAASGTQVVTRIDDDTLLVENVGREVAGEPLPASPPVRMKRVAAADED
ncbi:MAG: SgcJ/EcaC family oxidoreductase [Lacipirellulaceae bacterium]